LHDEKVRRRSAKLCPPYISPYEITEIDDVNVTLRLPRNRTLKVHAYRLRPFIVELQIMAPAIIPWTVPFLLALLTAAAALDATLQTFKESPGLYYDYIGEAQLYNTEWRLLTYIDLCEANQNLETTKKYAQLSIEFCNKHQRSYWFNITDCTKITRFVDRQVREIEELKSLDN
jgi:hypothetical protein